MGKGVTREIAQPLGLIESTDVKTAAWLNRKSSIILLLLQDPVDANNLGSLYMLISQNDQSSDLAIYSCFTNTLPVIDQLDALCRLRIRSSPGRFLTIYP